MTPGLFEVREFERIEVTPSTTLLRVSGEMGEALSTNLMPTLLLTDGEQTDRLSPLPTGPESPGIVFAAFRIRSERLADAVTFSLDLGDDKLVDLGSPVQHPLPRRRPARTRPDGPETAQLPVAVATVDHPAAPVAPAQESRRAADPENMPTISPADTPFDRWLTGALGALGAEPEAVETPAPGPSPEPPAMQPLPRWPQSTASAALDQLLTELAALPERGSGSAS